MYLGDSRNGPNDRYTLREFKRVSSHEFGHAIGIGDGIGWGYGNTSLGAIYSVMATIWRTPHATRLDLELALAAHAPVFPHFREWPSARYPRVNRDLLERYGVVVGTSW